jgi:hypothetical protein
MDIYLEMELLEPMLILFDFLRNGHTVFHRAIPFYTPTSNVTGDPISPYPCHICYYLTISLLVILVDVKWNPHGGFFCFLCCFFGYGHTRVLNSGSHVCKAIVLPLFFWQYWDLNSGSVHQPFFFVMGFFKIGSHELFAWAGFEP